MNRAIKPSGITPSEFEAMAAGLIPCRTPSKTPTFEHAPAFPSLHNRRKTDQPAEQTAADMPMKAHEFLNQACVALKDRAASRDRDEERSMARCVAAFNAASGHQLSETDGWLFMVMLKIARHYSGDKFNPDDFIDGASYMGLGGECEARKAA